jgi:uncharacterized protein YjdB
VQVTPETMTLAVGQRQPIFAAAYDGQGNLLASAKFRFWSSDTMVAQVLPEGVVVGVAAGLAKVEARLQGRRASTAILVTAARPAATPAPTAIRGAVLALEPASVLLVPRESTRVVPQALHEDGTPAPPGVVSWRSLRPDIVTVDDSGLVAGIAPGRTVIQATAAGLTASASVHVEPAGFALSAGQLVMAPGGRDTLRAQVPSQGGRELRTGLRWQSTDTTVARVGPTTGVVEAVGPGEAQIVATGFGQERRALVRVHKPPQALVLSPLKADTVQVPLRGSQRFSAVAEAADSTPIPELAPRWEVGDTAVATFDSATGTLGARGVGATTLTARVEGFEPVTWRVRVVPGTLQLDRTRLGLAPGEQATLTATVVDAQGGRVGPAEGLHWSSNRPEVAAVTPGGSASGVSLGRATLTAVAPWGASAALDVFVVGDLLLASSRRGSFGIYQLRLARPDSLVPVLADGAVNVQPALSPDRTSIAFVSNRAEGEVGGANRVAGEVAGGGRGGSYDLYVMDADGRNVRRLTAGAGLEGEPTWSPDGARIVFTTGRGAASQLYAVRPDGGDLRPLATGAGGSRSAAFSPDGRAVAFVSTRDGNDELYLADADGGNPRRLTRTPESESRPRFFPNGDLLWVTARGRRGGGSTVLRGTPGGRPAVLATTDRPIVGLGLSRRGDQMAYVVARGARASRARVSVELFLQSTAPGSAPTPVRLAPNEQVVDPTF